MPETTDSPARPRRAGFRDDIQGMRAFAVLAILVFHAGFSPYPGGFVTLDVFFVLSGYLITTLLLREIAKTGNVDLLTFYSRRARRILPAATVTTVGTVVAAWLWLPLVEAQDTAVDAVWAALFGANIRFALEETDYFAQGEPASPLQHYWSLAVEEQFYLVLPAMLLGCVLLAAWSRRRTSRTSEGGGPVLPTGRVITVALVVVSAASFAWSVHASTASPESAYFSTFTRVWEFGVGCLLAQVADRLARDFTHRMRTLLSVGGFALILGAMFLVTEDDPFPGWLALLPVVGTALVILAGTALGDRTPPPVQRALGWRPLVVVGDASYSLYLWHWPVLIIARQRSGGDLPPVELVLVLAVVVLMTFLSYRFVEQPFRRPLPRRLGSGMVLYPTALTVSLLVAWVSVTGIERDLEGGSASISVTEFSAAPDGEKLSQDSTVALVQASTTAALEGAEIPGGLRPALTDLKADKADTGACNYDGPPYELCARGDADGDKTLVLLGNSHGRHWIPAFEEIAQEAGYRAYYLVKSKCTAARVETVLAGDDEPWTDCDDFNDWATRQVEDLDPDLVVVSTTGVPGAYVDGKVVATADGVADAMRDGYEQLWADLKPLADRVVDLSDVPRREDEPGECLSRRGADLGDCLSVPAPRAAAVAKAGRQTARAAGVEVVDPTRWFCADGQCPAVVGQTITMRDNGHMTTVYAEELATPLGRALDLTD
ncbi:MAG: hypothetical protein CMH83_09535 [Nocardioides sp.]|nr:hypothetical protein [Nocardioides sp.]